MIKSLVVSTKVQHRDLHARHLSNSITVYLLFQFEKILQKTCITIIDLLQNRLTFDRIYKEEPNQKSDSFTNVASVVVIEAVCTTLFSTRNRKTSMRFGPFLNENIILMAQNDVN